MYIKDEFKGRPRRRNVSVRGTHIDQQSVAGCTFKGVFAGVQTSVGDQRCGSRSSMRLLGHVGSLSITSLR